MTLIFEASGPFQKKPGLYKSRTMYRIWWLWFAVGLLRVSFKEFAVTSYDWSKT